MAAGAGPHKTFAEEPLDDVIETVHASDQPLDDALSEEQRLRLMRQLIATLPSDLRDVIVLSTVDEMVSAEIAQVLGIPEGSVRTRAHARTPTAEAKARRRGWRRNDEAVG